MTHGSASDFTSWRDTARELLRREVQPDEVIWTDGVSGQPPLDPLFEPATAVPARQSASVPRDFLALAQTVACHRDPERWAILYRTLYRLTHGERSLLQVDVDDDVRALRMMEKAVHRDIHKMHAFVRFRKVEQDGEESYVAWHRPDHHVVEAATPFFTRRFGPMRWAVLTPDRSAYWDTKELRFGPGVPRSEAPPEDALEELWRSYYASVFNPARLRVKAMKQELPVRHWATLPEAQVIPELIRSAQERVVAMKESQPRSAAPFVPLGAAIPVLREAVQSCQGCDLCQNGTRAVLSEGSAEAEVVLVGEQPGDEDERNGRPFSGPAGRLLDKALAEAGLDRSQLYITNSVKHFKYEMRGKRRIHQNPSGVEVSACRPWLEAELQVVKPRLIVALGGTAAGTLMGKTVTISRERGVIRPHRMAEEGILVTMHPAGVLRVPDPAAQERAYDHLVEDLRLVGRAARPAAGGPAGWSDAAIGQVS